MAVACPPISTLQDWLSERATAEVVAACTIHVADCPTCQSKLDHLSDDPELRRWADGATTVTPGIRTSTSIESKPPPRVGPYLIEAELGRGGMGVVYRGTDEVLNRTVAVKLLRSDVIRPDGRERFLREARAVARVLHPHVVGLYAAGCTDDGAPYLAMEYVPGATLAELIRSQKRRDPRAAVELIVQIADGLAAAHAVGLIHRDVKPANVLMASPIEAKLADFGLARDDLAANALTVEGTIAGTPSYLSPEQARGESADARSDVYGLGVTLYEMLTGEVPFRGVAHQVLVQVMDDEPRPPRQLDDGVPADVETVVLKALAKEPGRRYQTANEFAADLRRWLGGEAIIARPAGRVERAWRWCRRNPRVATLTGVVAGLLLALAVGGTTSAVLIARAYGRAEQNRLAALASQGRAEADSEVALKSLVTLVETVQAQMGTQPGLLPLKKKLLETAAEGLNEIVRNPSDVARMERVTASAHERLGDVYLELGRSADARTQYETKLKLAEAWAERDPDSADARRSIAAACDRLGDLAKDARKPDETSAWCRRSLEHRQKLVDAAPDNYRCGRELAISLNRLGDAEALREDFTAALEYYSQALKLCERQLAGCDAKKRLLDLRFTRNRLSTVCVTVGDLDAAEEHSRAALEHAREYAVAEPVAGRIEIANSLERLAWNATNRFDPAAANRYREESVALRRAIAASDPGNQAAQANVATALNQYADALTRTWEYDAARAAYLESLRIYEAAAKVDPDSAAVWMNLHITYTRIIMFEAMTGQYTATAAMASRAAEFYRRSEAKPALAHLKPQSMREEVERAAEAATIAATKGLADPTAFAQYSPNIARTLLCMRLFELARQQKADEVVASAAELRLNSVEALIAARACGMVKRPEAMMAALVEAIRLEPGLSRDLALYPEFHAYKDRPDFQALRPKPAPRR